MRALRSPAAMPLASEDPECLEPLQAAGEMPHLGAGSRGAGLWRLACGTLLLGAAVSAVAGHSGLLEVPGRGSSNILASSEAVVGLAETRCHTAVKGETCWKAVRWAQTNGIYAHPEWYPELTPHSSFESFQVHVHNASIGQCPHKPCKSSAKVVRLDPSLLGTAVLANPSLGNTMKVPHSAPLLSPLAPPMGVHPQVASPGPVHVRGSLSKKEAAAFVGKLQHGSGLHTSCSDPLVPVPKHLNQTAKDWDKEEMSCGCPPPQVLDMSGDEPQCKQPDGPQKMSFYMYRAQSDEDFPPENVNAADLAGLMWYLHNEVVGSTPRKFHITRILRYKVTMQNTQEFYDRYPKQFGPFVAFDSARCTAPHCNSIWKDYGFVVGCQNLDRYVANYVRDYDPELVEASVRKLEDGSDEDDEENEEHVDNFRSSTAEPKPITTTKQLPIRDSYHSGIWYSLPGPCPESSIGSKSDACKARMPGGRCKAVNGTANCTYDYEFTGEISLDELSGILDERRGIRTYEDFWKNSKVECLNAVAKGHREGPCRQNKEYDFTTDKGVGCSFWDGKHDLEKANRRMAKVRKLFRDKYPQYPDDFTEPACL